MRDALPDADCMQYIMYSTLHHTRTQTWKGCASKSTSTPTTIDSITWMLCRLPLACSWQRQPKSLPLLVKRHLSCRGRSLIYLYSNYYRYTIIYLVLHITQCNLLQVSY